MNIQADSSREAAPFRTSNEASHLMPSMEAEPAALLINPRASMSMLIAAVHARTTHIVMQLNAWSVADADVSASPQEIVCPSLDLAEQIELLLSEVESRLSAVSPETREAA